MSLEIGTVLADRYRIDGLLGEGGMGAVYRVWDTRLDQTVALKENLEDPTGRLKRSTDPVAKNLIAKTRERFEIEAKVLARLRHFGLPQVRDHFIIPEEGQYLVMDFVEGQDLQVLLKQVTRLPEERVIEIGIQVCEILDYLHNQNPPVIHRDIKPANLRMTPDGKVILVDFGICKEGVGQATKTAARAVSEGFSPIEMYGQYGGTDARSDIYSLGATLLALLTGEALPSPTDRTLGRPLPHLLPAISRKRTQLYAILEHALSLKPEDRYQSANEMQDALRNLSSQKLDLSTSLDGLAGSQTSGERTRVVQEQPEEDISVRGESPISKKWLMIAGGLSVILVAVLLAVYFSQRPFTIIIPDQRDVIKPNQPSRMTDSVARAGEQPDSVLLLMVGKGRSWMRIRKDADTSTFEGMIRVNDTLWFAMQDSIYIRLGRGNAADVYLNALPLKIADSRDTSVVDLWISRDNYLKYVDSSRLAQ